MSHEIEELMPGSVPRLVRFRLLICGLEVGDNIQKLPPAFGVKKYTAAARQHNSRRRATANLLSSDSHPRFDVTRINATNGIPTPRKKHSPKKLDIPFEGDGATLLQVNQTPNGRTNANSSQGYQHTRRRDHTTIGNVRKAGTIEYKIQKNPIVTI